MNSICVTCDTKNRLKLCDGKKGDFLYCFRKCGSIDNVKDSIFQFNDPEELRQTETFIQWNIRKFEIIEYYHYVDLVVGQYGNNKEKYPIGYIIK